MASRSHPTLRCGSAEVRRVFPVLADALNLNTGTVGPMAKPALDAYVNAIREIEERGVASRVDIGRIILRARRGIARLIGASVKEIAFTRNATDGINLALAGIVWRDGDEVITTDEEHEAVWHPLLYLQARGVLKVVRVPVSHDAATMVDALDRASTKRTRLVVASHVTCETGTRLPAREICAWAGSRGILSLVDGAQSLGVFPVNVREIGCDFYTGNGHKWLHGPTGTGIFYATRKRLRELVPAHVGAGSLERADFANGEAKAWDSGSRFEYGTWNFALMAGLDGAIKWLGKVGWEEVAHHIEETAGYAKERLSDRPYVRLITPIEGRFSSGLVSFEVVGSEWGDIGTHLRTKHAIYTRPVPHYNATRISIAHFTNRDDIDRLVTALDGIAAG